METIISTEARALCRVEEIADGGTVGFPPAPGGFSGLVAYRKGEDVKVFVNSCPHIGTPLDWMPDQFMSRDGKYIICATHGAAFAPLTGECLLGPCKGDYLDVVKFEIRDGVIHVPASAGL
ncbi:MAG: Rieske (2Fe-2S) protein [Acetobacteraceae bacterium]|nr:Rieske (2Fe-2S) protein [Acetobacteraceae bacterium]